MNLDKASFIVVDVETTGAHPEKNRMTEIACVVVSNGEVREKFSSLINPHQFIPQYIANMTGISNEMAFKAPDADDVLQEARPIFEKETPVFVAHNANFDWGFVQASFRRSNLPLLQTPVLCTLKLARKLLPKELKKNVGSLAEHFGITVSNRHRALGDAEATAYILIELLDILKREHDLTELDEILDFQNKIAKFYKLSQATQNQFIEAAKKAPFAPGIFYLKDTNGNVIFIKQSNNLKERFMDYAHNAKVSSQKLADILTETVAIEWQASPNVLASLVHQHREIEKYHPRYNAFLTKENKYLALTDDDFPRLVKTTNSTGKYYKTFGPFESTFALDKIFDNINKRFKLRECEGELNPSSNLTPCFHYDIGRCNAPCSLEVNQEEYFQEVEKVAKYINSSVYTDKFNSQLNLIIESNEKPESLKSEIIKLNQEIKSGEIDYTDNSFILIEDNTDIGNTYEVYLIKSGILHNSLTLGRKSNLNKLQEALIHTYFNGSAELFGESQSESEAMIINKWLTKYRNKSYIISVKNKNELDLIIDVENSINSIIY